MSVTDGRVEVSLNSYSGSGFWQAEFSCDGVEVGLGWGVLEATDKEVEVAFGRRHLSLVCMTDCGLCRGKLRLMTCSMKRRSGQEVGESDW